MSIHRLNLVGAGAQDDAQTQCPIQEEVDDDAGGEIHGRHILQHPPDQRVLRPGRILAPWVDGAARS
ncbi:MAG: hypothetical protein Kow00109_02950 [Acidobacteriota bacterium]